MKKAKRDPLLAMINPELRHLDCAHPHKDLRILGYRNDNGSMSVGVRGCCTLCGGVTGFSISALALQTGAAPTWEYFYNLLQQALITGPVVIHNGRVTYREPALPKWRQK